MEKKAKRELGVLLDKGFSPEDIRGKLAEGMTHPKRREASGRKLVSSGIILIIMALLLYL